MPKHGSPKTAKGRELRRLDEIFKINKEGGNIEDVVIALEKLEEESEESRYTPKPKGSRKPRR